MYFRFLALGRAQALLLPNWVSGLRIGRLRDSVFWTNAEEERMMLEAFGSRYQEYMARTYRVIPLISRRRWRHQFRGFFATFAGKHSSARSFIVVKGRHVSFDSINWPLGDRYAEISDCRTASFALIGSAVAADLPRAQPVYRKRKSERHRSQNANWQTPIGKTPVGKAPIVTRG